MKKYKPKKTSDEMKRLCHMLKKETKKK